MVKGLHVEGQTAGLRKKRTRSGMIYQVAHFLCVHSLINLKYYWGMSFSDFGIHF